MSSTEHPLRPYYVAPAIEDSIFSPALSAGPKNGSSRASPAITNNRYARVDELLDLDSGEPASVEGLVKGFLSTSLLGFASTAIVQPFEVGKVLLQVQWIPKEAASNIAELDDVGGLDESRDFSSDVGELSDEGEAEAYFADATSRMTSSYTPRQPDVPRPQDASGYLLRRSIYDEATKPEYTLPVIVTGGVWQMIRAIGQWKGEGWFSLWKGQLTSFSIDALASTIQPFFLSLFISAFAPASSLPSLPLVHSPYPLAPLLIHTSSHLVTGLLLSPLDLIRTRLIVQSCQPRHRKYTGPIQGLGRIMREEGGLSGVYTHASLIIPAVLDYSIRPLLHLAAPLLIERIFNISASDNAIVYSLLEFVVGSASLLITLPIETVRRRLQLQSRTPITGTRNKAFRACVETRPAPYAGVVEAIYRIITEETGSMPLSLSRRAKKKEQRAQMKRRESAESAVDLKEDKKPESSGLRQLYRGLGIGVSAQACVFLLTLVSGSRSSSNSWSEM